MRIVFLHQNMPGQFKHLARKLAENEKNKVVFITKRKDRDIPNVTRVTYEPKRGAANETHRYLRMAEEGILHGQQVARVALTLREKGFTPDVIVAHPGWGEALYLKDIWPDAPLLNYFEFYYHAMGADVGFNPEEKVEIDDYCRIRTKNIVNFMALESADAGLCPTEWQYRQNPEEYKYKISVIHDGVDTFKCTPNLGAQLKMPNGKILGRRDEVITYIARNLEPYRGFPWFMEAVQEIQKRRPNAHVIIVGGDGVSYGRPLGNGKTYRQEAMEKVKIDPDRTHFLGNVPYNVFLSILQVSSAHVYLTYPFVLSWSMIEAMSSGCLVIGSRTPPVEEAIRDRVNGMLVDFFKPMEVADRVDEVMDHKDRFAEIRERARQTVLDNYDLEKCMAKQLTLIKNLALGHRPVVPPLPGKPGQPLFQRVKKSASDAA